MVDRPPEPPVPPTLDPPPTDRAVLNDAIDAAGAAGFVAVGGRSDPDLRYLTRFEGPDAGYAFVHVPGRSVLCAPAGYVERAAAQFDGTVETDSVGDPPGERAAAVLDDQTGDAGLSNAVLVPRTIPHDAAVYLERAGYEPQSTAAVAEARVSKTDREVDAIRAVQGVATAGVREAERLLAAADVGDTGLRLEGRPLTADRLRRAANAELVRNGVTDAGNTVVRVGPRGTAGGGRAAPARTDLQVRTGEPVTVAVAPRGPHGYHGSVARTFVVDSDGGWARRAYVAVESALDAALAEIEAGTAASAVGREAGAELTAFGFDPAAAGDGPTAPGHGVGLARRERPRLDAGVELAPGNVVAVTPQVADPERGTVRLSALVVVTPEGYDRLGDDGQSFAPQG